ncbi:MAG: ferredoxin--NADP(+) reductase, partial [Armatimonadota bacterium]
MKDVTIIGAGPVGLFGAFYAGMRGMSVRVVDSQPQTGGQLTALYPDKPIYDMPGFPEISARDLANAMALQAGRFHPEYVLGCQAESLVQLEQGWRLGTKNGDVYLSRTVIICGGVGAFQPTRIGLENESHFLGKGLGYGVQDRAALVGKRVVVVGGGDSAVDWALALEGVARSVTLIHRRDQFRAHEESVATLMRSSVALRLWEEVVELKGSDKLVAVVTQNRQTQERTELPCDFLSINIGYKTDLGPIRSWGLELQKNKIVVNSLMETNRPGVYAAGDICTHHAKLDLIATGVGEVCIAVNVAKT